MIYGALTRIPHKREPVGRVSKVWLPNHTEDHTEAKPQAIFLSYINKYTIVALIVK